MEGAGFEPAKGEARRVYSPLLLSTQPPLRVIARRPALSIFQPLIHRRKAVSHATQRTPVRREKAQYTTWPNRVQRKNLRILRPRSAPLSYRICPESNRCFCRSCACSATLESS